jgi:hypothetical protein
MSLTPCVCNHETVLLFSFFHLVFGRVLLVLEVLLSSSELDSAIHGNVIYPFELCVCVC